MGRQHRENNKKRNNIHNKLDENLDNGRHVYGRCGHIHRDHDQVDGAYRMAVSKCCDEAYVISRENRGFIMRRQPYKFKIEAARVMLTKIMLALRKH